MRSVVAMGVSTCIGRAAAKLLPERGFRAPRSVRIARDAERLRNEFGVNFVPLSFDVTGEAVRPAAAGEVCDRLDGEVRTGLVDNADLAAGKTWQSAAVGRFGFHA